MKRRVIIFATTYFPLVGGAEVAVKEITDRLPDFEFDLICARIKRGLPSEEKIGNVTVHRVGIGHPIDKYLLPILGPIRAIHIPHSKFQIPSAWSLMASYGGFAAWIYCRLKPRTKFLLTLQEGDPLEHYAKRVGALSFFHRAIFKRADAVQAISRFLAGWALRMGFEGEPLVIPNGVDVEKFASPKLKSHAMSSCPSSRPTRRDPCFDQRFLRSSQSVLGRNDEEGKMQDIILVTASRLSLKNGVDDLIRSLEYLPDHYKIVIAGDGEDREALERLVAEHGWRERVVFLGHKTHDELPAILHASDVFVRASLSEGLGNSFLEAMAAGIPVVGTRVGGIPDFLTDGETGVFCEVRNPKSIADAARRLEDPELRGRIIAQGQNLVVRKYDWDKIAEQMGGLLQSLCT